MAAASEYVLEPIRDGAEFTLYRGRQRGNPSPLLVVAPTGEPSPPQSLRRLEHEYSLAAELEPAWAAKPLALTRYEERAIGLCGKGHYRGLARFVMRVTLVDVGCRGPPFMLTVFSRPSMNPLKVTDRQRGAFARSPGTSPQG